MAKPISIKQTEETIKSLQSENFNLKLRLYLYEKNRNGISSIPSSALLPEVHRLMTLENSRRESDSQTEEPCLDWEPSLSQAAGNQINHKTDQNDCSWPIEGLVERATAEVDRSDMESNPAAEGEERGKFDFEQFDHHDLLGRLSELLATVQQSPESLSARFAPILQPTPPSRDSAAQIPPPPPPPAGFDPLLHAQHHQYMQHPYYAAPGAHLAHYSQYGYSPGQRYQRQAANFGYGAPAATGPLPHYTSDSDDNWSEPDREVARARMGIDDPMLLIGDFCDHESSPAPTASRRTSKTLSAAGAASTNAAPPKRRPSGMSSLGLLSDVSEMLNNPGDYSYGSRHHRHEKTATNARVPVDTKECQTELCMDYLDIFFAEYDELLKKKLSRIHSVATQTEPAKSSPKTSDVYCQVEMPPKKKHTQNTSSQIETLTAPRINKQVQVTTLPATDNIENKPVTQFHSVPPLHNNNLNNLDCTDFSGMEDGDRIANKYLPTCEKKALISSCIKTATIKRFSAVIEEQIEKINSQLQHSNENCQKPQIKTAQIVESSKYKC